MSRRRRETLSSIVALLVLAAGLGIVFGTAGYLVQSARNRAAEAGRAPDPGYAAPGDAGGFDLQSVPARAPALPAYAAAPASSPLPVYSAVPPPASAAPGPAAAATVPPAPPAAEAPAPNAPSPAERAARGDARFSALLAAPAAFIARHTLLGSSARLAGFLRDRARWGGYIRHPLIAGVLRSPALVRLLVTPTMVRAFVQSPAMRDRAAVKALAYSPLLKEILASRGVRENLKDPLFLGAVYTQPAVIQWMTANPEGAEVLNALAQDSAAIPAGRR